MLLTSLWERGLVPASKVMAIVSAVLAGSLALFITAEVVMRGVTGGSIRGMFEIAELGLVMTVFLGLSQAEVDETHVRVTLLTDRLPQRAAQVARGAALVFAGVFVGWMSVELILRAMESYARGEYRTGLLNFPVWPSRTFVAFGTTFLSLTLLLKGLLVVLGRLPRPEQEVIAHEL